MLLHCCCAVLQGASGKMTDLRQKYKEAEQQRQHGESPSCAWSNLEVLLLATRFQGRVAASQRKLHQ
jgi:hypothetical protein